MLLFESYILYVLPINIPSPCGFFSCVSKSSLLILIIPESISKSILNLIGFKFPGAMSFCADESTNATGTLL